MTDRYFFSADTHVTPFSEQPNRVGLDILGEDWVEPRGVFDLDFVVGHGGRCCRKCRMSVERCCRSMKCSLERKEIGGVSRLAKAPWGGAQRTNRISGVR